MFMNSPKMQNLRDGLLLCEVKRVMIQFTGRFKCWVSSTPPTKAFRLLGRQELRTQSRNFSPIFLHRMYFCKPI